MKNRAHVDTGPSLEFGIWYLVILCLSVVSFYVSLYEMVSLRKPRLEVTITLL
jgi:hypothetical protein